MENTEDITVKLSKLQHFLKKERALLVAFSGGVDSTLLAKVAHDTLGNKCHAITCISPTMAKKEINDAISLGKELGFGPRHHVIQSSELKRPGFADNPTHRCALCKTELMEHAMPLADRLDAKIALGTNIDDLGDLRPGIDAAKSRGAISPMVDAKLSKEDVRQISRFLKLRTWDKPQLACLSSRFPYGTKITEGRLQSVDSLEDYLYELGFKNIRVRYHGDVARIEVDVNDFEKLLCTDMRKKIVDAGKSAGFVYVALDLAGFRSGSLNEPLLKLKKKI